MNCDFGALQNGQKLPLYFSMVIKKVTFDKNLKGNVVASNAQKSAEKRHLKWEEAKGQFIYQTKKPNEVFLHEWQINLLIFLLGWGNNFAASTKIFNVADISWQDMKTYGSVNFTKIIISFRFSLPIFGQPYTYGLFQTFEKRWSKSTHWSSKCHLQHQLTFPTRKCGTGK